MAYSPVGRGLHVAQLGSEADLLPHHRYCVLDQQQGTGALPLGDGHLEAVGVASFLQQLHGALRVVVPRQVVQTELFHPATVGPDADVPRLTLAEGDVVDQPLAVDGEGHGQANLACPLPIFGADLAVAGDPRTPLVFAATVVAEILVARAFRVHLHPNLAIGVGVVVRRVGGVVPAPKPHHLNDGRREYHETLALDGGVLHGLDRVRGEDAGIQLAR